MSDRALHHHEPEHPPGRMLSAVLNAIDAGLSSLHRLRDRLYTPEESDPPRREPHSAHEALASVAAPPRRDGLLKRTLPLLACLLGGGLIGTGFSYHTFAKLLESREAVIEQLREDIEQAQKEEAISLNARIKLQREAGDYRKHLREALQEIEDYKSGQEELKAQIAALKRSTQPAQAVRQPPPTNPVAGRRVNQKTGSCVTGSVNPGGNLKECLERFNRP